MVVSLVFDVITGGSSGNDGDFNDRLNHKYSAVVLAFSAVFALSTQLIGSPINCWTPANWHPTWAIYAENICFVNKTYYIEDHEHISVARGADNLTVEFYQWYPVILVLMGALFYAPQAFWTGMLGSYEIDLNKMVNTVDNCELVIKPEDRKKRLYDLAIFLDRHLETKKRLSDSNKKEANVFSKALFKCRDRDSGASMGTYYLFVKIAMVANAVFQIVLLNWVIGSGAWYWGFEVMWCMLTNKKWTGGWRFPLETFCDVEYHNILGTTQLQTIECVLGVNLYNERIFLFVWFWLYFMLAMNTLSVFNWASTLYAANNRVRWVEKHILMGNRTKSPSEIVYRQEDEVAITAFRAFVLAFLKPDGVFMLRLISANTTSVNMTELMCNLWDLYIRKPRIQARFPDLENLPALEEHDEKSSSKTD